MPTKNPRINITFNAEEMSAISAYAHRNEVSLSAAAKQFMRTGMELDEDAYWVSKCDTILVENTQWHSAEEVWGK